MVFSLDRLGREFPYRTARIDRFLEVHVLSPMLFGRNRPAATTAANKYK